MRDFYQYRYAAKKSEEASKSAPLGTWSFPPTVCSKNHEIRPKRETRLFSSQQQEFTH